MSRWSFPADTGETEKGPAQLRRNGTGAGPSSVRKRIRVYALAAGLIATNSAWFCQLYIAYRVGQ